MKKIKQILRVIKNEFLLTAKAAAFAIKHF